MTPIAPHITAFLQKRLAVEKLASPHTCDAYAYGFQLLFEFMSKRLGVAPADIQLEQLDAPLVLEFLDHLGNERGNSARTRNARLAAIRSFMRFVEHRVPSALDQVRRVRAIAAQKTHGRIVRHLTIEEQRALLDAPDPTTRLGTRDRVMLQLALTGGLRVMGHGDDSFRFRACARPPCDRRCQAMPIAPQQARLASRPAALLRAQHAPGDAGPAQGLALAWPREHPDH
jgi:site-specific recombinase XerD